MKKVALVIGVILISLGFIMYIGSEIHLDEPSQKSISEQRMMIGSILMFFGVILAIYGIVMSMRNSNVFSRRNCPECGRKIPFDARACPYCKKDFEE